jgi:hypothetical protein
MASIEKVSLTLFGEYDKLKFTESNLANLKTTLGMLPELGFLKLSFSEFSSFDYGHLFDQISTLNKLQVFKFRGSLKK